MTSIRFIFSHICFLSFMFYKFAINIYECISFHFFIYNRFILIYGDGDILNKQKNTIHI